MFQKDLSLCSLYDKYAPLLSDKQKSAFELYYLEDLSLAEIAEHTHTSRQAVRELVAHTAADLKRYEEALMLCQKQERLEALCQSALALSDNSALSDSVRRIADAIKE